MNDPQSHEQNPSEGAPDSDENAPGPEVTEAIFAKWRSALCGVVSDEDEIPKDVTNPYWLWLFRNQIDPYSAREYFKGNLPTTPGPCWAGNRMGMSTTQLADGRTIWVAGEHEDHYDPDFFIYNDVIVRDANQEILIYAYSRNAFPPTDFHTATLYENESKLLLIGALDYTDNRKPGTTRVQSLDLDTFAIKQIETTGQGPGWIHRHKASVDPDGTGIIITDGSVFDGETYLENINDWHLSFSDWKWTQLTDRKWTRIEVQRKDKKRHRLFDYGMLKFDIQYCGQDNVAESDLAKELGIVPDMELYAKFYVPSASHRPAPVEQQADDLDTDDDDDIELPLPDRLMSEPEGDEWRTHSILIDETRIRMREDSYCVMITVEGELPDKLVRSIAQEMCDRLAKLENAECELVWHVPT